MAAGSRPAACSEGAITSSASAIAERSAALPVRSTPALRDFTSCDAMSTTTFGLASKFAPITPTGRRRSDSTRPPGRSRTLREAGSGSTPARISSCAAIALSRPASSLSRSRTPAGSPFPSAARMSSALAASTAGAASDRAWDIAPSAASIASSLAAARPGAAARAARAAVRTASVASVSSPVMMNPLEDLSLQRLSARTR